MTELYTFLWDKLAQYYTDADTNKDSDGEGTFQRFMLVFGVDITNNAISYLEDFINQLDPYTADNQYLTLIAWAVGNPQDILNDYDIYKIVLSQIISIYQIKGTIESYKLLFALMGLSVELQEFFPQDNQYDSGLTYDDDTEDATTYDFSGCDIVCSDYSLIYSNLPGSPIGQLSTQQENDLIAMVKDLIQPWTARLRDLTYVPPLPLPVTMQDTYINNSSWTMIGRLKKDGDDYSNKGFFVGQTIVSDFRQNPVVDETYEIDTFADNRIYNGLDILQQDAGVGAFNIIATWIPLGNGATLLTRTTANHSVFKFQDNLGIFFINETLFPLAFVIFLPDGVTRRVEDTVLPGQFYHNYRNTDETISIRNMVGNGVMHWDYYLRNQDGTYTRVGFTQTTSAGDNNMLGLGSSPSGVGALIITPGGTPTGVTIV